MPESGAWPTLPQDVVKQDRWHTFGTEEFEDLSATGRRGGPCIQLGKTGSGAFAAPTP